MFDPIKRTESQSHCSAMKRILLLITLLCLEAQADEFFRAKVAGDPDHLVPVKYPPDDYDKRIAKHLFVTSGSLGRFVVRPSHGPETCVSIHAEVPKEIKSKYDLPQLIPDTEQKYFITVTRPSESLWYAMDGTSRDKNGREVKVIRVDREISLSLAIAIQRAWGRMLQRTRYPSSVTGHLDGTTLEFSVWVFGLGDLYGRASSPREGLPAEITSIGFALADFASNREEGEEALTERLKAFEAKIPSTLSLPNELNEEEVEWESISPSVPVIEKLRTNLPTPKPPLRRGPLISMDGQTVAMPNGKRAFYSQLDQIATALIPKDQEGVLILVSYLHDRDPHIRFMVSLALDQHLENNKLGNDDFYLPDVARDLQDKEASKAIEDIVRRVSKLKRLEDTVDLPNNTNKAEHGADGKTPEAPQSPH